MSVQGPRSRHLLTSTVRDAASRHRGAGGARTRTARALSRRADAVRGLSLGGGAGGRRRTRDSSGAANTVVAQRRRSRCAAAHRVAEGKTMPGRHPILAATGAAVAPAPAPASAPPSSSEHKLPAASVQLRLDRHSRPCARRCICDHVRQVSGWAVHADGLHRPSIARVCILQVCPRSVRREQRAREAEREREREVERHTAAARDWAGSGV